MEALSSSLVPNSGWLMDQSNGTAWTKEDNKNFEIALAFVDEKHPHRWVKVASFIPGKSVHDVMNQYEVLVADVTDIEKGLVPIPGYLASSFTFEVADNSSFHVYAKRARSSDHERKKGVPWTEDEHRRFLLGLEKHGKGDWRSISRNFVMSKTPTQVASHAQKYYLRQNSGSKDRKRPSIHDITIVADRRNNKVHVSETYNTSTSMNPSKIEEEWDQNYGGQFVVLNSTGFANELIEWSQSIDIPGTTEAVVFSGFEG